MLRRKNFLKLFIMLLAVLFVSPVLAADKYQIDPKHSTIGFAVKHLQISMVRGSFDDYSGEIQYDPQDLSTFSADVTIQANSIDTKVEGRDTHLKSADFFDAEKFPTITFKSTKLEKRGEGAVIVGDLTIKGVTKSVTIPVEVSGPIKGMQGDDVIGIIGQTFINRQEFGVSWSKNLDNGGLVVDDKVTLVVEIEAHKK